MNGRGRRLASIGGAWRAIAIGFGAIVLLAGCGLRNRSLAEGGRPRAEYWLAIYRLAPAGTADGVPTHELADFTGKPYRVLQSPVLTSAFIPAVEAVPGEGEAGPTALKLALDGTGHKLWFQACHDPAGDTAVLVVDGFVRATFPLRRDQAGCESLVVPAAWGAAEAAGIVQRAPRNYRAVR
ncbi:MAG: hypothetical protein WC789_05810 [Lentisphaeria bacterium]